MQITHEDSKKGKDTTRPTAWGKTLASIEGISVDLRKAGKCRKDKFLTESGSRIPVKGREERSTPVGMKA